MSRQSLPAMGGHKVIPSAGSDQTDFDFLTGQWVIHNRKLKTRLADCNEWVAFEATGQMDKILNGLGNIDDFITTLDGKLFEGMTLRLFNPETKLWSIYWADSNRGVLDPPVHGSFDRAIGHFYANDTFDGRDIVVLFQWDKTDPDNPVWSQAFSLDQGKSWEWNWYMYFHRA